MVGGKEKKGESHMNIAKYKEKYVFFLFLSFCFMFIYLLKTNQVSSLNFSPARRVIEGKLE